ncbi:MAG: hypothetical protein P8L37_01730, partial [Phycisphaerales bacterium]|nr:hypothetical protein [Phycisphaerales bacterium]
MHVLSLSMSTSSELQSAQLYLTRLCSQMPGPSHALHVLRALPCWQKRLPPHFLQPSRLLPCSQTLA